MPELTVTITGHIPAASTGATRVVVAGWGRCSGGIFGAGGLTWLAPSQVRWTAVLAPTRLHHCIMRSYGAFNGAFDWGDYSMGGA